MVKYIDQLPEKSKILARVIQAEAICLLKYQISAKKQKCLYIRWPLSYC